MAFTDDGQIQELNTRYLSRPGPTNILAFPMRRDGIDPETPMLGDIVLSLDAAGRDARESGEDFERTVDRLLIHGLLHLFGYDHEGSAKEARRMEEETERLLDLIEAGKRI